MTYTRNARTALLIIGAAAALTGLLSLLSNDAARAGGGCPEKTLCVWEHNEGDGQLVKITKDGISNKLAKKLNNGASSVINNRNKRAYLYDGKNGKGDKVCLSPGAEVADLGGFAEFNDRASSSKNADKKTDCPKL
jgi:hypothetical protein